MKVNGEYQAGGLISGPIHQYPGPAWINHEDAEVIAPLGRLRLLLDKADKDFNVDRVTPFGATRFMAMLSLRKQMIDKEFFVEASKQTNVTT